MRIAKKISKRAKKNKAIITRLTVETGKSYPTIMRWFDTNNESLTNATCLRIICEEMNLTQEEVLTA